MILCREKIPPPERGESSRIILEHLVIAWAQLKPWTHPQLNPSEMRWRGDRDPAKCVCAVMGAGVGTRPGKPFTRMCHVPLAGCTTLPTSCPRHTLPELFSKSHCSVPIFLKCLLDYLSSQGPSVTLPLPETTQSTKPKVLSLHFRSFGIQPLPSKCSH